MNVELIISYHLIIYREQVSSPITMTTEGLSTGKTILIGTIVLGCFAVLWPKIFAPMLFGEPELPRKHGKYS